MDALESLKGYGSDSSSDEETSSQRDSDLKLPSLPASVLSMFQNDEEDTSSNSQRHQGRQRSFPHVPGNWATFVYCRVSVTDAMTRLMADLVDCLADTVDVELMEDVHISLSRTVALQHHWIDPFTTDLRRGLDAEIPEFDLSFNGVKLLTNDEKTRSFLALTVGVGSLQLQSAVDIVDKCLQEFALPVFYKDACFHASFAWFLGNAENLIGADVQDRLEKCFYKHRSSYPQHVDRIWCKTGCKQFVFQLNS